MDEEEGRAAIWEIDRATGADAALRLRPAQPQRHGLGAGRPARCGRSVNERDEIGSDLVPDYMTSRAGRRLLRLALQLLRPARRRAREAAAARPGAPRRSRPTTRWARTPRRWAWPSTDGARLPGALARAAPSSASTARGTASRVSGYKVVFVPFAGGKPSRPAARRAHRLPQRRRTRRRAGRSAWPSTRRRPAGRRRRRQRDLAGDGGGQLIAGLHPIASSSVSTAVLQWRGTLAPDQERACCWPAPQPCPAA